MEGRPPGEVFAQQRWDEFFPRVGYVLSLSQIDARFGLQPSMPYQQANSIGPMAWASTRAARRRPY